MRSFFHFTDPLTEHTASGCDIVSNYLISTLFYDGVILLGSLGRSVQFYPHLVFILRHVGCFTARQTVAAEGDRKSGVLFLFPRESNRIQRRAHRTSLFPQSHWISISRNAACCLLQWEWAARSTHAAMITAQVWWKHEICVGHWWCGCTEGVCASVCWPPGVRVCLCVCVSLWWSISLQQWCILIMSPSHDRHTRPTGPLLWGPGCLGFPSSPLHHPPHLQRWTSVWSAESSCWPLTAADQWHVVWWC